MEASLSVEKSALSEVLGGDKSTTADSVPTQPPKEHYKNVKLKYYRSLGVNNNLVPSSLPNHQSDSLTERMRRAKAIHIQTQNEMANPNEPKKVISPNRKKRSTSTPIPISGQPGAIPIPGSGRHPFPNDDEEFDDSSNEESIEEEEEEEALDQEVEPSSFVPPHEMLARQHYSSFAVGTAHSVAVWEQKRRNLMNV